MKQKHILLLVVSSFITLISLQVATAQSWVITGNNNTTALSKLGTTNFIPLNLYTNNAERVRIDELGRVGIGTSTPANILTVQTGGGTPLNSWINAVSDPIFLGFSQGTSGEFNIGTASSVGASRRPVFQGKRSRGALDGPTAVLNNDFLLSFVASGYDGSAFQNPATIDFFVDGAPSAGNVPGRISFVTGTNTGNRLERLQVKSNGDININQGDVFFDNSTSRVGIGTTVPERKLHVFNGSAGVVTSNANSSLVVEDNGNNYISVLAPSGSERGILFGDQLNAQDGGIVYVGSTNALHFRTNGNATRMSLSSTGDLSLTNDGGSLLFNNASINDPIGTSNELRTHGDFNPDSDGFHSLGTAAFTWFDVWATDATINTSDARLKENVENLSYGLDEILKLRPVTFNWIKYKDEGKRIGLIAQEVQKVIPEMVKDSRMVRDEKTGTATKVATPKLGLAYDALIPVLVKAIQEQDAKMKDYESKIDKLTKLVESLAANNGSTSVRPVKGYLSQNSPNPPVSNSTRIGYSLPEGTNIATIIINDISGRKLKEVRLNNSGDGYVNVNTSLLSKGTYTYSLYVNGQLADTKKMVLLR